MGRSRLYGSSQAAQRRVGAAPLATLVLEGLHPFTLGRGQAGSRPASVSARRTHLRSVSGVMPSLLVIKVLAAHCEGYSRTWPSAALSPPHVDGDNPAASAKTAIMRSDHFSRVYSARYLARAACPMRTRRSDD